jgi:hypothetical protein
MPSTRSHSSGLLSRQYLGGCVGGTGLGLLLAQLFDRPSRFYGEILVGAFCLILLGHFIAGFDRTQLEPDGPLNRS